MKKYLTGEPFLDKSIEDMLNKGEDIDVEPLTKLGYDKNIVNTRLDQLLESYQKDVK